MTQDKPKELFLYSMSNKAVESQPGGLSSLYPFAHTVKPADELQFSKFFLESPLGLYLNNVVVKGRGLLGQQKDALKD